MNSFEINWSNLANYQAFLETEFSEFLNQQGAAAKTRKNYRTDLRHFFSWTILTIQSSQNHLVTSPSDFLFLLTPRFLENYRRFLIVNRISRNTINRRLSTIRAFIRCCLQRGWLKDNPTLMLQNLPGVKSPTNPWQEILELFVADLRRSGASKGTIKNYSSDVKRFFTWLQNHC